MGEKIKSIRLEKGLTQDELAKHLGIKNRSTIASWESGISSPDYETLKKIAVMFGVTTDYIIGLVDEKKEKANVLFSLVDGTTIEDLGEMMSILEPQEQQQIIDLLKGLKAKAELKKKLKEEE